MSAPRRFLHQRIDDEEVWVDLEAGRFFGLNETGTAILEAWRDGARDAGAITDRLVASYDAPRETIHAEVEAFLGAARERGLLDA